MNRVGDNFKTEKTKIFIYPLNSAFLDLTATGICRGRWHQHFQQGIKDIHGQQGHDELTGSCWNVSSHNLKDNSEHWGTKWKEGSRLGVTWGEIARLEFSSWIGFSFIIFRESTDIDDLTPYIISYFWGFFFYFDMISYLKEPSPSLLPQRSFLGKNTFYCFWERNFSSFCKNKNKTQRVRGWPRFSTIPASPCFCTYPRLFRLLSKLMCLEKAPILLSLIYNGQCSNLWILKEQFFLNWSDICHLRSHWTI